MHSLMLTSAKPQVHLETQIHFFMVLCGIERAS
jgi:hypothetical protein